MIPAAFEYVRAESVGHALELMERYGDDARLLAGGHSLIPAMKLRLAQPRVLIDIGRLGELKYIRREPGVLAIGALTTHWQLESSELVAEFAPALAEAARSVADVQVRNRGTIGGVLAHADPMADYPAVVLALGAEVVVAGKSGTRSVPIDQFFAGPFMTAVQPGEMVTEIRIPTPAPGSGQTYRKFVRRACDYGLTGVAAYLAVDEGGVCRTARIGITCVGMQPYRASGVEAALEGRKLTEEVIREAAELAVEGVMVAEDAYTRANYRAHLCRVETRRAITEALARAGKGQ